MLRPRSSTLRRSARVAAAAAALALAGCGGGESAPPAATAQRAGLMHVLAAAPAPAMSTLDAVRLAQQASFGPTEALVAEIRSLGAARWIAAQMAQPKSRYTSGKTDAVHQNASTTPFCDQAAYKGPTCWRDWYSSTPQVWDFYRNAVSKPDQLRQRVAFALSKIVVVSDLEAGGSYGFRNYANALGDNAFANYRDVLKKVILSPLMGTYLNHANNDAAAPNENFARELLQLFTIGTCALNQDGSLAGGSCQPAYDNDTVRAYAYALTGWTYPPGGADPGGCRPAGTNCLYLGADMVPAPALRDAGERRLLRGATVLAGSSAPLALGNVLDSLMGHPNLAPFIGRQLIQQLVTSNPSPAYVARVAAAFTAGRHVADGVAFGAARRGDLAATVAAVLLDAEARTPPADAAAGKLREPVLLFTGVLRALNGSTDGDALGGWWGAALGEHVFRAPSVFAFYSPDHPLAGSDLVGPEFGIHGAQATFNRLNFVTQVVFYGGVAKDASVPNATGTSVDLRPFEADAADPGALVDRLSVLATGAPLPAPARTLIVDAVATYSNTTTATWKADRVAQAAYLVFASPQYQVQR